MADDPKKRNLGNKDQDALVLGIPRGGVVVADEVAKALNGELDVIVTKKMIKRNLRWKISR